MTFQVTKPHKLSDQIEALAYDWVFEDVCQYFGVEDIPELTEMQADALFDYAENLPDHIDPIIGTVLRTMHWQWEEENL
jgi:hypothetical protein